MLLPILCISKIEHCQDILDAIGWSRDNVSISMSFYNDDNNVISYRKPFQFDLGGSVYRKSLR